MNILAKIWSGTMIVFGIWAIFASMLTDVFDGALLLGGLMFFVTAVIAMTYILVDDKVQKEHKRAEEEDRIANLVARRMNGGR